MQRFYFELLEEQDDSITIKNPLILNQMLKVLRVKEWEEFLFFNWNDDTDYIFKITSIDKREIYLVKEWFIENNSELDFDINIIWALPNKLEKIEYIIQKWVEIWVSNFMFFKSERSQNINLSENKIERLNKIIIEAVEQSGRSKIPELAFVDDLNILDFSWAENIIFHTKDEKSVLLKDLQLDYDIDINLFVWPEWGFSDEEITSFEKHNFKKVHLWNRILRTETTWIVAGFYIIQNK